MARFGALERSTCISDDDEVIDGFIPDGNLNADLEKMFCLGQV